MTNQSISIEVVNNHRTRDEAKTVTYIGRGSPYGNPFPMHFECERDEVCDQYYEYFVERLESDSEFVQSLQNLADLAQQQGYLRLGCFCAPKRCHGFTIAGYLVTLLKGKGCRVTWLRR